MKPLRVLTALAITTATFVAVACSIDVELANKACPCGPDYVCDESRNLCITPAEFAALDGAVVLEDGAIDPGACPDDKCPCGKDGDCKDPARARCNLDTKTCVECLRAPTDTCGAGNYCNDQNLCTLGCKQESDCQISPSVPHCNLNSHQCVQCLTPTDCPGDAGLLCSPSGTCVEGCNLDAGVGCPAGKTCCGLFCLDIKTDVLNCGACENACSKLNATPSCSNGTCQFQCAQGYGHCATGNTGCETNHRTDVTKCGNCNRNCLENVLNAVNPSCNPVTQNCSYQQCKLGFGNCNGFSGDGCECSCGSFAGEICCPGNVCTFDGGKCVGSNPPKCQ